MHRHFALCIELYITTIHNKTAIVAPIYTHVDIRQQDCSNVGVCDGNAWAFMQVPQLYCPSHRHVNEFTVELYLHAPPSFKQLSQLFLGAVFLAASPYTRTYSTSYL